MGGAANQACVRLIADAFGVRKSQVEIAGGAGARDKRVVLRGVTPDDAARRLAALAAAPDNKKTAP